MTQNSVIELFICTLCAQHFVRCQKRPYLHIHQATTHEIDCTCCFARLTDEILSVPVSRLAAQFAALSMFSMCNDLPAVLFAFANFYQIGPCEHFAKKTKTYCDIYIYILITIYLICTYILNSHSLFARKLECKRQEEIQIFFVVCVLVHQMSQ